MVGSGATADSRSIGDWRQGYRTDAEYTFGFYPMLSPDALMLASVLRGVRPPADVVAKGPEGRRISYCELGCGQGLTLNVMAARDPDGHYTGIDYNPAQIRNARSMAEAQGIQNLTLIEDSFAELDLGQLPDFDIIVLHGIYSWVAPEIRASIVNFIRRKLKAGGLCYISYNCAVGRGADRAMRQLLLAARGYQTGSPLEQAAGALDMVQGIAKGDSRYFERHQVTKEHLEHLKRHQPTYILHEYFGDYWDAFFFDEVARQLDGAKLSFVANSDLVWNRTDLCLTEQGRAAHDQMTRTGDRELIKDVWANQRFRRDIYAKGASELTPRQQLECLADVVLRLARPRAKCNAKLQVPAGVANLPPEPFGQMLDVLAEGPATVASLRKFFNKWADGDRRLVRAIEVLCAVQHVELAMHPSMKPVVGKRFSALSVAIAGIVDRGTDVFYVPTLENGLAASIGVLDYFLLRAHRIDPARRVEVATNLLLDSGRRVSAAANQSPREAAAAALAKADAAFVTGRLPDLLAAGAS